MIWEQEETIPHSSLGNNVEDWLAELEGNQTNACDFVPSPIWAAISVVKKK